MRTEADDNQRKAGHFQREVQKVKQQNVDLSQQVSLLSTGDNKVTFE